jgi:GAF domain-containing protein
MDARTVHLPDVTSLAARDDYDGFGQAWLDVQLASGITTWLGTPLVRSGQGIGSLVVVRRGQPPRPFTPEHIALIETYASQAMIAIENARLFQELQERLEQETATSEILRVIAGSPADLQPVLHAIAASAARLCGPAGNTTVNIYSVDGGLLRWRASYADGRVFDLAGADADGIVALRTGVPLDRGWIAARSVIERRTLNIADVLAEPEDEFPISRAMAEGRTGGRGYRAVAATPLFREGAPIGAISVTRREPGALPDRLVRLLETFADQAVIALENTRLFSELQESNRTLKEALAQQTATAEVLQIIAGSPTSVEPGGLDVRRSHNRLGNQALQARPYVGWWAHGARCPHGASPRSDRAHRRERL